MVKKKLLAGIGAVGLSLSLVGTAFAAPANPTTDSSVVKQIVETAKATDYSVMKQLVGTAIATAKYHDVNKALKDGFVAEGESVSVPGLGTMGIHYINYSRMGDGKIDTNKPECLLYVPTKDGGRELVGVEFIASVDEWVAAGHLGDGTDNPTVFGQVFEGPMDGHGPGEPRHFDKHVWLWKYNPSGLFAQFNPAIK